MDITALICKGGRPDRPNEDRVGYGGGLAWVIDGATGLVDHPLVAEAGQSDASWLAAALDHYLSEQAENFAGRDIDGHPSRLLSDAVAVIARLFNDQCRRQPEHDFEKPCASVVLMRYDGRSVHTASLGDCSILVDDGTAQIHAVHGEPKHAELDAQSAATLKDLSPDGVFELSAAREKILPLLKEQRNLANTPGGYGVFGIDPACVGFIREHEFPLRKGSVLMMSDGFYALVDKYGAYDDAGLLEAARHKGLETLYGQLRKIEEADPNARKYARLKKSDDASALLINLSGERGDG